MKRRFKASYTIEASYILPIIIVLIWYLLFLSFFLYDQCVIMQGSYQAALRAERLLGTKEEKEALAFTKYEVDVKKKLIYMMPEKEIEVDEDRILLRTNSEMKFPGGIFFQKSWKARQQQKAASYEPVKFIRECRRYEKIWKKVKEDF